MIQLKLYVLGKTISGQKTIDELNELLRTNFKGQYNLKVFDVLENPKLAINDKILATPTVIKELPDPIRRIIGNLSDKEKVLLGLDLIKQEK